MLIAFINERLEFSSHRVSPDHQGAAKWAAQVVRCREILWQGAALILVESSIAMERSTIL